MGTPTVTRSGDRGMAWNVGHTMGRGLPSPPLRRRPTVFAPPPVVWRVEYSERGIARIKAITLVACHPARLAIAAVLLSLSATALAAGQTTGSIEGAIVDPEREPMTWRRGDGDRPRRAPGTCDRRGRRLHGRRSGARRLCRHGGAARLRGRGDPGLLRGGCHGNDPDRAADHAPARNGQRGRRGAPDLRAHPVP